MHTGRTRRRAWPVATARNRSKNCVLLCGRDCGSARTNRITVFALAYNQPLHLRHYCDFELSISVQHVMEQIRQLAKRYFTCHEIGCGHFTASDCIEGFPYEPGRMVERGLDRDLRVMQKRRFDFHSRFTRTTTEQIDGTAT